MNILAEAFSPLKIPLQSEPSADITLQCRMSHKNILKESSKMSEIWIETLIRL